MQLQYVASYTVNCTDTIMQYVQTQICAFNYNLSVYTEP